MKLVLEPHDAALLEELLDRALGDIREEVYKTDNSDYRAGLRKREEAIERLLGQVRSMRVA